MSATPSNSCASLNETTIDAWEFCQQSLVEVSRTFSQPIQLLPDVQARALTVGYLLCRVADTIEDSTGLEPRRRDDLFSLFQAILRGEESSAELARQLDGAEAPDTELRLVAGLPQVMQVFLAQKTCIRASTVRWVSEMADGMRLYGRRAEGREFNAVYSLADLERYCYFVAGTVGHLITELFVDAIDDPKLEARLRPLAESFGLGLQLVNILKDVTDDFARGVCYLPRQTCREAGFEPEDLLAPENRAAAHQVHARVSELALTHLDNAFEYTLLIPREHDRLRLFCLLPLWMAVESIAVARGNDAVFRPGAPVKIDRQTVEQVASDGITLCQDDDALRARYALMRSR